jgi:HD-like signal output (HDOD) protein
MPHVVFQLVDALGDSRTSAADLEEIIESDQALASKVLSLSNSAFYGFSQKISTIQRAVVAIGFSELQLLALGTGLADVFDHKGLPEKFNGEGMWIHSIAVAWIAKKTGRVLHRRQRRRDHGGWPVARYGQIGVGLSDAGSIHLCAAPDG